MEEEFWVALDEPSGIYTSKYVPNIKDILLKQQEELKEEQQEEKPKVKTIGTIKASK